MILLSFALTRISLCTYGGCLPQLYWLCATSGFVPYLALCHTCLYFGSVPLFYLQLGFVPCSSTMFGCVPYMSTWGSSAVCLLLYHASTMLGYVPCISICSHSAVCLAIMMCWLCALHLYSCSWLAVCQCPPCCTQQLHDCAIWTMDIYATVFFYPHCREVANSRYPSLHKVSML